MVRIIIDGSSSSYSSNATQVDQIFDEIFLKTGLKRNEIYLIQNGKLVQEINANYDVHALIRLVGGKGGFGSMLRAIGAQIEKTSNREACRDLSGRRLRDINEEKRLKAYLEKQKETDEDPEEKFMKKIGKLTSKPKAEFKDERYETTRADLTQNIDDSVEIGFKKAMEAKKLEQSVGVKRKAQEEKKKNLKKKKKSSLWLGADMSSSSDTSDSESEASSSSSNSKEAPKKSVKSSTITSTSTAISAF